MQPRNRPQAQRRKERVELNFIQTFILKTQSPWLVQKGGAGADVGFAFWTEAAQKRAPLPWTPEPKIPEPVDPKNKQSWS